MEELVKSKVESAVTGFDPEVIKKDFPILSRRVNGKRLIYLDSAATTQKPQSVIAAIQDYYANTNANVHRGIYSLAEEATSAYEATRSEVAEFIGGVKPQEIIFTRSATEAINLVAYSWAAANIKSGDRIITTQMEHHANLVPWIVLAKKVGAELEFIRLAPNGQLDLSQIDKVVTRRTKLVAVTQMSNVLGTINAVEQIVAEAHKKGALVLIDGAQSVPHMPVDVKALDADFVAFSAHKMLGPTGVGILYGKEKILEAMEPFNYGGEMIDDVRFDNASWAELPYKFEAGTPNISGVVGFGAALRYLKRLGMAAVREHERDLTAYALDQFARLDSLTVFGPREVGYRGGVVSFVDKDIHPHDLATLLDTLGIAIRVGHHCAQPLTRLLGVPATARASLYIYNTKDDIDQLVDGLKETRRYFGHV